MKICNLLSVNLRQTKKKDYPWKLTTVTVEEGKEIQFFAYADAALDFADSLLWETDDKPFVPTKGKWMDQPTIK